MNNKIATALGVAIIIIAASVPRMLALGTMITIDEPLWVDRSFVFIKALAAGDWEKTATGIQPGVTTTWIGGLASHYNSLFVSQFSVALTSVILILLCTYGASLLWGNKIAWFIGMTLALDPFLIAHGRVIHTDSLITLFSLSATLFFLSAFQSQVSKKNPKIKYLVVGAALFGLAILTKIFAVIFFGIFFLYALYEMITKKYPIRKSIYLGLIFCGTVLATCLIAYPALLTHPIFTTERIVNGITQYSEGTRNGEATSMWWYYPRALFFRETPAVVIMFLVSIFGMFTIPKYKKILTPTIALLAAGILYALALSIKGERSDRYILYTFVTIDIVAIIGYCFFITYVFRTIPKMLQVLLLIIPLAWMGWQDIQIHPYYLSYYNPLYPIEQSHKLGWGEGLEQAAMWIYAQNPNAHVASYYPRVFSTFYKGAVAVDSLSHIGDHTDYIVLYRSMFERGPNAPETDILNEYLYSGKYDPVHTITINNLPYVWIFKDPSTKS